MSADQRDVEHLSIGSTFWRQEPSIEKTINRAPDVGRVVVEAE
jgi:hypothetical protein